MKRCCDDAELWEEALRDVTVATFAEVSGGDRIIDVIEFQRWLAQGWRNLKAQTWLKSHGR